MALTASSELLQVQQGDSEARTRFSIVMTTTTILFPRIAKFLNLPCQFFDAALHFATMTTFMAIEQQCFIQHLVDVVDVDAMVLKHTTLILNLHCLRSTPSVTLTEQHQTHHQTLLILHSVAPSQPEFQVVNLSVDSDHPPSHLGKGSWGRHCRKWW